VTPQQSVSLPDLEIPLEMAVLLDSGPFPFSGPGPPFSRAISPGAQAALRPLVRPRDYTGTTPGRRLERPASNQQVDEKLSKKTLTVPSGVTVT
jgi:hypothetical protein